VKARYDRLVNSSNYKAKEHVWSYGRHWPKESRLTRRYPGKNHTRWTLGSSTQSVGSSDMMSVHLNISAQYSMATRDEQPWLGWSGVVLPGTGAPVVPCRMFQKPVECDEERGWL
jgi:hypothetical protein